MNQNSSLQIEASTLSQEVFLQDASKDSLLNMFSLAPIYVKKESYVKHTWTKRNVPELRMPNITVTAKCPAEAGNSINGIYWCSENETFASKQ